MTKHRDNEPNPRPNRNGSRVRVLREEQGIYRPSRRRALAMIAGQSVGIPAACVMSRAFVDDPLAPDGKTGPVHDRKLRGRKAVRPTRTPTSPIIRDFADPVVELHRLLREASEVEHALMVQYLYAAFSLKPAYESLMGYGDANARDLLGVAIQEMQHLAKVNQLLVVIGAAPCLLRQDFPNEPDIYPFELNLEPLSRQSVAKYVYTEAPASALDRSKAEHGPNAAFIAELDRALGPDIRPNHVGSLYSSIITVCEEIVAADTDLSPKLRDWIEPLKLIQDEGEEDHFEFFKSVFMGTHEAFADNPDVWALPTDDPAYPSLRLPINPSAYVGHDNQIEDPDALNVAWLGDLHYWSILLLLDFGYRVPSPAFIDLARTHMMGPFWSIMRHLPTLGTGMPFDPLSLGYSPGIDTAANCQFIRRILEEANELERWLADALPQDFPQGTCRDSLQTIDEIMSCAHS